MYIGDLGTGGWDQEETVTQVDAIDILSFTFPPSIAVGLPASTLILTIPFIKKLNSFFLWIADVVTTFIINNGCIGNR